MTRDEFILYLKSYNDTKHCEQLAAYLNHLARGRPLAFTEYVNIASDGSHILNTDPETFHLVYVPGNGYTYVRNDKSNILRCVMNVPCAGERTVFFAKSDKELCHFFITRMRCRNGV